MNAVAQRSPGPTPRGRSVSGRRRGFALGWIAILHHAERRRLVYEAGWRHRDARGVLRTMKRRLGPAWLERDAEGELQRRRGRVRPGYLDEPAAIVARARLVREVEQELAERAAAAERESTAPVTFREVAHAYLDWLGRVRGAKPATPRDHRYLLAEPGARHRRGAGAHPGLVMAALGNRPAAEVTTREINALLAHVAAGGASARTVNKQRQLICAIYSYGCQEATFSFAHNPAIAAPSASAPVWTSSHRRKSRRSPMRSPPASTATPMRPQ